MLVCGTFRGVIPEVFSSNSFTVGKGGKGWTEPFVNENLGTERNFQVCSDVISFFS